MRPTDTRSLFMPYVTSKPMHGDSIPSLVLGQAIPPATKEKMLEALRTKPFLQVSKTWLADFGGIQMPIARETTECEFVLEIKYTTRRFYVNTEGYDHPRYAAEIPPNWDLRPEATVKASETLDTTKAGSSSSEASSAPVEAPGKLYVSVAGPLKIISGVYESEDECRAACESYKKDGGDMSPAVVTQKWPLKFEVLSDPTPPPVALYAAVWGDSKIEALFTTPEALAEHVKTFQKKYSYALRACRILNMNPLQFVTL